jgi:protein FRA10AC1
MLPSLRGLITKAPLTLHASQFALRWRTEAEVLSGAGENTCGNTRCKHHDNQDAAVQINTLELPFAYEEHGERKSALVKVVLCPRCLKKLMWKRNNEKAAGQPAIPSDGPAEPDNSVEDKADDTKRWRRSKGRVDDKHDKRESSMREPGPSTRRRTSRSRSPRDRKERDSSRRRRSPSP